MSTNLTKFQQFQTVRISRKQILNAPYNPRKIDSLSYKKLKNNIKGVGLIETLVWNVTSGNLVSGHQRLKILDELEKRDDYDLDVAQVEMDKKTEMEQNIFLNNSSAQGEFDRELIMQILPEIDILKAGFTEIELNNIGIEFDLENHQDEKVDDIINQFDIINVQNKQRALETASSDENHQDWKQIKKGISENESKRRENTDSYIVLTFTDHEKKASFCRRFGFEEDIQYIKGEMVEKFIRESTE